MTEVYENLILEILRQIFEIYFWDFPNFFIFGFSDFFNHFFSRFKDFFSDFPNFFRIFEFFGLFAVF